MDPTTASYYRAILTGDSQDSRPLPQTLIKLHQWAIKRTQAMGLGSTITKASALNVALTWLSTTEDGRAFASEHTTIGDMFCDESEDGRTGQKIDWSTLPAETKVVVVIDGKPTTGEYLARRFNNIDVRIAGEKKTVKRKQVHLAGV
jgi:hypothetical protein